MPVFKCKMCGGSLEISENMTVCECEYCGTLQTLPKSENEQALNMYNRANHFRQQCEFDKAAEIYERMTAQKDDAELYWSIVLCRYGIEYVDDPLTKKKIATCHRTQFKSILEDADYLQALELADESQRLVYKQEAEYIDKVQKGILEISNKEKPFDVFICYKETDENGKRTQDSVLAQELYYQLEREGFKVFFSRITLESKLGSEYEPYIFAALNSAKVMVVVGTKPEYFNAVWVKNEWSRYLMLMNEDRSLTLIPAYKDMDPYDLPDALSMFQAQDMSKLGFMQDLIRGITKIAKEEPKQEAVKETVVKTNSSNIENLIKRGKLALEDKDWDAADNFFEQILNEDVEEARAYIGKLQAHLEVSSEEELGEIAVDYSNNNNYKKAYRFADDDYKVRIKTFLNSSLFNLTTDAYNSASKYDEYKDIRTKFENLELCEKKNEMIPKCTENMYNILLRLVQTTYYTNDLDYVEQRFKDLEDYMDLTQIKKLKNERFDAVKNNESKYQKANQLLRNDDVESLNSAISILEETGTYKNSEELKSRAKTRLKKIARNEEYERKIKEISSDRKNLYEELKHLGVFSKKRKQEIEYLLSDLAKKEKDLKEEYEDILK